MAESNSNRITASPDSRKTLVMMRAAFFENSPRTTKKLLSSSNQRRTSLNHYIDEKKRQQQQHGRRRSAFPGLAYYPSNSSEETESTAELSTASSSLGSPLSPRRTMLSLHSNDNDNYEKEDDSSNREEDNCSVSTAQSFLSTASSTTSSVASPRRRTRRESLRGLLTRTLSSYSITSTTSRSNQNKSKSKKKDKTILKDKKRGKMRRSKTKKSTVKKSVSFASMLVTREHEAPACHSQRAYDYESLWDNDLEDGNEGVLHYTKQELKQMQTRAAEYVDKVHADDRRVGAYMAYCAAGGNVDDLSTPHKIVFAKMEKDNKGRHIVGFESAVQYLFFYQLPPPTSPSSASNDDDEEEYEENTVRGLERQLCPRLLDQRQETIQSVLAVQREHEAQQEGPATISEDDKERFCQALRQASSKHSALARKMAKLLGKGDQAMARLLLSPSSTPPPIPPLSPGKPSRKKENWS